MPLLYWDESYASGVADFDSLNRDMLLAINQLNDCVAEGREDEALSTTFTTLLAYVREGIPREERLLAQNPDAARHRREHAHFAKAITTLHDAWRAGDRRAISSRLLMILVSWWVRHGTATDRELAEAVKARAEMRLAA